MPRPKKSDTPVREKILHVANDLFFAQGYHQTGTNQLIQTAGVSKAGFYSQFASKEDLAVAYVRQAAERSINYIQGMLDKYADPAERYMMFTRSIWDFMLETDFRGCNFGNIAKEFPDPTSPVRVEVIKFENRYRDYLRATVQALFDTDPERYGQLGLSVEQVTDRYYLLLEGALSAAANFHEEWPLHVAEEAARDLVKLEPPARAGTMS